MGGGAGSATAGAAPPRTASKPVADSDPSDRRVLFDALVRVLAGSEAPLMLVLDDLQWCDGNTIEFIGYLVSRAWPRRS